MAYDRTDMRRDRGRSWDDDRGRRDDRGFFERAGDEIASWFGDDEAERRRRHDERMHHEPRWSSDRDYDRDFNRDRDFYNRDRDFTEARDRYLYGGWGDNDRSRDRYDYRGQFRDPSRGRFGDDDSYSRPTEWTSRDRDYGSSFTDPGRDSMSRGRGYGRMGSRFAGSYMADQDRRDFDRPSSRWDRDDRSTSFAGSGRTNDRHYDAWRQRQLNELDRDYDQYCRERQDRFESDFGSWREDRMNKRQQLGQIREHMEVVGSDGESVGTIDKVRGDRIILTKSDSDDGRHHSIDCSIVDKVEGDKLCLEVPAEEAKSRFEEEGRGRSDRIDHEGPSLERSFSGTYSD